MVNIFNAEHCKEGEEPKRTTPSECMLIWDKEERERIEEVARQAQSIEEMKNAMMSFTSVHNTLEGKKVKVDLKRKPTLLKDKK